MNNNYVHPSNYYPGGGMQRYNSNQPSGTRERYNENYVTDRYDVNPNAALERYDYNDMAGYHRSYSDTGEDIYGGGSTYSAPPSHSYDRPWANQYLDSRYSTYSYGSNYDWNQQQSAPQHQRAAHPSAGSSYSYGSAVY